jgi:hypothetical protein
MANASNMMIFDIGSEARVYEDRDWTAHTKNLLKAEMKRRGLAYAGLVEKLAAIGIRETEANLRNKISRGGFTGAFLIQCLTAMGVKALRLEE